MVASVGGGGAARSYNDMQKLGYLRVSTHEQRPDRQIDGLAPLCDDLYIEHVSAVRASRPVYESLLARLEPGDTLLVWDLDRAFRSVVDAILELERLHARGVGLRIVNLQVDTTTPSGMLVYTIMSAFAEFERRLLSERTKEGLAAARRRGKRLGRPPKLTPEQLEAVSTQLRNGDATLAQLARIYNLAPWSLTRALRRMLPH